MTSQEIVDLLNELVQIDPKAIKALCKDRVPCNEALADHPTVTVDGNEPNGPWTVGLLGILEGIAGIDGELIASIEDEETGDITAFKLIAFEEVKRQRVQHIPSPDPARLRPITATANSGITGGYPLYSLPTDHEHSWIYEALRGWVPEYLDPKMVVECNVRGPLNHDNDPGMHVLRLLARYPRPREEKPVVAAVYISQRWQWLHTPDHLRTALRAHLDRPPMFRALDEGHPDAEILRLPGEEP